MNKKTTKRCFSRAAYVLLAAVLSLAAVLASACSGGGCRLGGNAYDAFYFVNDTIYLTVGESKTFSTADFGFDPSAPASFRVGLSSDDESVVTVSGITVEAVGMGRATLTAKDRYGYTATCTVEVTREVTGLDLVAPVRARTLSEGREIEVYAVINGGTTAAAAHGITWSVNGRKVAAYNGSSYTVPSPATPANYIISASAVTRDGFTFSDEVEIAFYEGFASAPEIEFTGEAEQVAGSETALVLKANYALTGGGDPAVVEWFDGGEPIGEGDTLEYVPSGAGRHEITALVNGTPAGGEVSVAVTGSVRPSPVTVDFDTFWPSVAVRYRTAGENERFEVQATRTIDGEVTNYETSGGCLMLSETQVNLAASGYIFTIKSLGDGDALGPSETSLPAVQPALDAEKVSYLEKTWFGGNYYISSDDEFCDFYDYMMLYRRQPGYSSTSSSATVYMGYNSAYTADALSSLAFARAGYTGEYEIDATRRGDLIDLSFTFKTRSSPTFFNRYGTVDQLNAMTPHVSAVGRETFTSALDKIEKSATVTTTDQLYRVAELGYRPVPEEGSPAENAYNYAKDLLRSIIDDGMTEVERAHAIYDWIMWRVSYDNSAAAIEDVDEAVRCAAFYIEGVLTDTSYNAVCDGMSKAYSLLCNMEGLPCVRVVGSASTSSSSSGGHAWNKVKVDGKWYIVDCTWGDSLVSVRYKMGVGGSTVARSMELASHEYFLRTDAEMASTHFEDEGTDYPRTATVPYNFFSRGTFTAGGQAYRTYITAGTDLTALAAGVAGAAREQLGRGTRTFDVFGGNALNTTTQYFGIEIGFAENAKAAAIDAFAAADGPLTSALSAADLYYNVFALDDCIVVITSSSVRLV